MPPRFAVIIPTLNEADHIANTIITTRTTLPEADIIVVDGGSSDATVKIAMTHNATIIHAQRGRACQMNAGAKASTADYLIFNHADCILPTSAAHDIEQAFVNGAVMTAFRVQLQASDFVYRLLEQWINNRSILSNNYTGDQSFAINRKTFEAVGGFPQVPICEDIFFILLWLGLYLNCKLGSSCKIDYSSVRNKKLS